MTKNGKQSRLSEEDYREDTIRLMGENATAIIHELKSPLSGIYAQLQLMEKRLTSDGYSAEAARFNLIYKGISQINGLCEQIMGLASGKFGDLCPTKLAEICKDTAALLRALAISSRVSFELDIDDNCPYVLADETQIRRLIINLVANAIQILGETDESGKVLLSLKTKDNKILVQVSDNGPGIPHRHLDKIFEPFFTTRTNGHGMGLYLCKEIAEIHGGTLSVISAPGKGATFTLTLPAAQ